MAQLRHPNVVQYLGACMTPPCLLMEHCSRRSIDFILANALKDEKVAGWGAGCMGAAWGLLEGCSLEGGCSQRKPSLTAPPPSPLRPPLRSWPSSWGGCGC